MSACPSHSTAIAHSVRGASYADNILQDAHILADKIARGEADIAEELRGLYSQVVEAESGATEERLYEVAVSHTRKSRPWRATFSERRAFILGLVLQEALEYESRRLRTAPAWKDPAVFTEAVSTRLVELSGRVAKGVQGIKKCGVKDPVVSTFLVFAEDLASDLRAIKNSMVGVTQGIKRVDLLCRLYDTYVDDLWDMEVGVLFVEKLSKQLGEPMEAL